MKLDAVTFLARDLDALAAFYAGALALEETVDDAPRYRELPGGGTRIGFVYSGAYGLLGLEDEREPTGLRSVITFLLPQNVSVDGGDARSGARSSRRQAGVRHAFGQRIAVFRDPEGNAFRISADLP